MTGARVRTLVVDDSAFARKVLREVLAADPRIEVVGLARDGLEALEKIAELKPDVVTLDLVMPNLDGVGVLKALQSPRPSVVVVSVSDSESDLGILALESGAVELVHKPTALATAQLYELGSELVAKVILAAGAQSPAPLVLQPPARRPPPPIERALRTDLVVIGTSTGGPQALTRLLTALPADFPVPIAMVLHIPAGYTSPMAHRLDELCAIDVHEAVDGMKLRRGLAILARGGEHLAIAANGAVRVGGEGGGEPHTPSVDVLFRSAARRYGARVLGVVMTGMGSDGLEGAREIVRVAGRVVAESESSCIVYGMPRSIVEAGLAAAQAPLDQLAALITRML